MVESFYCCLLLFEPRTAYFARLLFIAELQRRRYKVITPQKSIALVYFFWVISFSCIHLGYLFLSAAQPPYVCSLRFSVAQCSIGLSSLISSFSSSLALILFTFGLVVLHGLDGRKRQTSTLRGQHTECPCLLSSVNDSTT